MNPNDAALFLGIGALLVVGLICIGLACAEKHIGDTDFYSQKEAPEFKKTERWTPPKRTHIVSKVPCVPPKKIQ